MAQSLQLHHHLNNQETAEIETGNQVSPFIASPLFESTSSTLRNSSSAASSCSTISAASTTGAGKFSVSSNDSSLSQKMSRLVLSRAVLEAGLASRKMTFALTPWA